VSGAICTHHQEHKLQSTAVGMRTITITHTYGCTLQFFILMMDANSTRNMYSKYSEIMNIYKSICI
jgi:hypothetical protein